MIRKATRPCGSLLGFFTAHLFFLPQHCMSIAESVLASSDLFLGRGVAVARICWHTTASLARLTPCRDHRLSCDRPFRGFSPGKTTPRDLCQTTVIAKLLHVSGQPKVTSETIIGNSRKEASRPNPVPQRCIMLEDDFGTAGGSRVPPAGRQLPVVSA